MMKRWKYLENCMECVYTQSQGAVSTQHEHSNTSTAIREHACSKEECMYIYQTPHIIIIWNNGNIPFGKLLQNSLDYIILLIFGLSNGKRLK